MKLEPTTERIIPENFQSDQESYLLYLMHVATYRYSLNFVKGKKVLDYGSGSGYGTALISDSCLQIIGVDVSDEAVSHARSHFSAPNLSYLQIERAEVAPLPFPDSSFDVVISFQVIEHVDEVSAYLHEIERVLVPRGRVLIATPDRSHRLFSFQKPWNIWHLREYSQEGLNNILAKYFLDVKVYQMGGQQEALKIELSRVNKLKWITLPFTLPIIPEIVRVNSLRFIKSLRFRLSQRSGDSIKPRFDESIFRISDSEKFSVNLIATGIKKPKA